MDLDVYNIQNNINIGDTSALIQLTSGLDYVMINAIVTKLNSQLPDATIEIQEIVPVACNSREITINYEAFNVNATANLNPTRNPTTSFLTATNNEVKLGQSEFYEPTEADKELTDFVTSHCTKWRDYRDVNFLPDWLEYERIFRGQWASEDKTRESERSRIVTPATQQAVETRHAEIMEAIFGQGDFFDIEDNIQDVNGNPIDIELIKAQLMEDFKKDKIRKAIDQIELMAEIYGTGIGEIVVTTEKEYIPSTQPIPGQMGQAAIGVLEKDRIGVKIVPVNPKNFLFDPNGTSIDDCMGVAIEKYVSIHKVVRGIEKGIYRKVDIGTSGEDTDLEPTQEISQYQDEKVLLLTYYGLVPREYLNNLKENKEVVVFFLQTFAQLYNEIQIFTSDFNSFQNVIFQL